MQKPKSFPERPLHKHLEMDSSANIEDVLDVKIYLHQKGFYDIPDYGLTPYPDKQMFSAIRSYQKSRGLKVDGVIKADGETQQSMRKDNQIEKEELAAPQVKEPVISGTNIPDRSPHEQGWDTGPFDLNGPHFDPNMDPDILKIPRPDIGKSMPIYRDDFSPYGGRKI